MFYSTSMYSINLSSFVLSAYSSENVSFHAFNSFLLNLFVTVVSQLYT